MYPKHILILPDSRTKHKIVYITNKFIPLRTRMHFHSIRALSGADPGCQVRGGGGALKKIGASGGRREHFWGISCEKSRFYAKKIIFFPILGGGGGARRVRPPPPPPPLDPPLYIVH